MKMVFSNICGHPVGYVSSTLSMFKVEYPAFAILIPYEHLS